MEGYIVPLLMLLAAIGGGLFMRGKKKRDDVKRQVDTAADNEAEGRINASLEFAERVKKAKEAVDAAIGARPVTDDPAADLADRIKRRRRSKRKPRQRDGSGNPTDWG